MNPLSPLRRVTLALKTLSAMVNLVRDPSRLEEVFTILDGLEEGPDSQEFLSQFLDDPRHTAALEARPRVGKLDLTALLALPSGSLGAPSPKRWWSVGSTRPTSR